MITVTDALALAQTKLRTRKVRTIVTIVVSGLLFSLAATVAIISDGVFTSYEKMSASSMTSRYIISGSPGYQDTYTLHSDPELIATAEARHKQLVNEKKAEAKRLGIEYDAASEPAPTETYDGNKALAPYLSPIAQQVLNEAIKIHYPSRTLEDFKKFASKYNPTKYYTAKSIQPEDGAFSEMKDGMEKFTTEDRSQQMSGPPADLSEVTLAPEALLSNYLLKDIKWTPGSGRVPVVVTQKRAATLTGYKAPGNEATADEKLSYAKNLRQKANGQTFEVCYRNNASLDLIGQALATAKEIEARKNDRDYIKPALIYGTPDPTSCGEVPIASDKRTAAEKQYDEKLKQFERKFNPKSEPVQQKITYEVVGVAPNGWNDMEQTFSMGVKDLVTGLLMTQNFRFAIPAEMYDQIADKSRFSQALATLEDGEQGNFSSLMMQGQYFAEFSDAQAARDFSKNESCQFGMNGCEPKSKYFYMSPFGSNSLALDEAKNGTSIALLWLTGIVSLIAAVIASLTIGRTIADGRRETSVFRAIGFKRLDIVQIYTTYTILLSLLTAAFTMALSTAVAVAVNHFLWLDSTVQAQLLLGTTDTTAHFSYVGFSFKQLAIAAIILFSGLVGMLLPLARNVRRNPIKDMRDE